MILRMCDNNDMIDYSIAVTISRSKVQYRFVAHAQYSYHVV